MRYEVNDRTPVRQITKLWGWPEGWQVTRTDTGIEIDTSAEHCPAVERWLAEEAQHHLDEREAQRQQQERAADQGIEIEL